MNMAKDQQNNENELLASATSEKSTSWGENAADLAYKIANLDRGDLAALRRMDPDTLNTSVLWRLLAQKDLLSNPKIEAKWSLVVHGIALMTRTGGEGPENRSAHSGSVSVGHALFYGGDQSRTTAFYGNLRFNRLMTARGLMLRTLMKRMFRMLASTGQVFNWREMARWILSEGYDESTSERVRRNIARQYYLAEHNAKRQLQTPEK